MKPHYPVAPQLTKIELALTAAVRLIADMDKSARPQRPIVVPELVIWALEKLEPSLILPLVGSGQLEDLLNILSHYAALVPIAESRRFDAYLKGCAEACVDYNDDGYLTPADMKSTLQSGKWKCSERAAYNTIARVLRYVVAREGDAPRPSYPDLNPDMPPAQYTHHRSATRAILASVADELDSDLQPTLATAVAHARRELVACDDGSDPGFWGKVYTFAVGDWLESDMPDVATNLLAKGLATEYFQSVRAYVRQMQSAEHLWNGLGHHVRELLRLETDEAQVLQLIATVVNAGGLHIAEDEVGAWSKRVWHMVQRRDSRVEEGFDSLVLSGEINALVDSVRGCTDGYDTCYLVDTTTLPSSFHDLTNERHALVTRLPEPWLSVIGELKEQPGFECFFWERGSNAGRLALSISRAFWFDYSKMWPRMTRFRRSIPVLYVFQECCVFVRYRFRHFSDLRAIADVPHKRRWSLDISGGNWNRDSEAFSRTTALPDGTRIRPSIRVNVSDMTSHSSGNLLREVYLRENSESALPECGPIA